MPTGPSQGTSSSAAWARAAASASPTVAVSGSDTRHCHWRAGSANTTTQCFMN